MVAIRWCGVVMVSIMAWMAGVTGANASVVITGTRVVYNESDQEVTVRLSNESKSAALVQTWLDVGNPNALPDDSEVPFAIVPPLFRMNPHVGQSLRVIYNRKPLPRDRESLFWLNVLEVPPKNAGMDAAASDANILRFALRTRIKFFFRPTGLPGSPHDAPASVQWKFVQRGQHYRLEASNPSAYHVTFTRAVVQGKNGTWTSASGQMVDPKGTADFDMGDVRSMPAAPVAIRYTYLDDYGAEVEGTFKPADR